MTERTTTDFTEHVFRSVRAWLHGMFPEPNIFISRKQAAASSERPAFRIEMATGPTVAPAAQGFAWADYVVGITYAAASQADAQRVVGKIATGAVPPAGRIPLKLYNWEYPVQPHVYAASDAAAHLAPAVDLALMGEDAEGNTTGLSARLSLIVDDLVALGIVLRGWQDIRKVRLYAGLVDGPLKLQAVGLDGDTVVMQTIFDGEAPPAAPVLPYSGIRVTSVSGNVAELSTSEETYDGQVSLGIRVLVPWSWVADVEEGLTP